MPTDKKQKRLTPEEYERAKAQWATGDFTLQALSDDLGVSRNAISKRFVKDGVKKGSARNVLNDVIQEQAKKSLNQAAFIKEHLEKSFALKGQMLTSIDVMQKRALFEYGKALKAGDATALINLEEQLKMIDLLSKITNRNVMTMGKLLETDQHEEGDEEDEEYVIAYLDEENVKEVMEQQEREEQLMMGEVTDEDFDLTVTELSENQD